jgi:hypothetical protein
MVGQHLCRGQCFELNQTFGMKIRNTTQGKYASQLYQSHHMGRGSGIKPRFRCGKPRLHLLTDFNLLTDSNLFTDSFGVNQRSNTWKAIVRHTRTRLITHTHTHGRTDRQTDIRKFGVYEFIPLFSNKGKALIQQ